ncbi:DeoR/GlpR transcriptional regulator (plasmid) [Qingshengfaniella alkalisoli]|uniref:DeoR/GlpR transcriptional regulator n=1 Tax=Qingshengfaniella alkalisoli TaxID=2599296 RepID=A0A5B8I945_9RHOB|nr:DeoR/GlpR family DNA-binding transcription regulator [Qingshengfaniella alkalisoli]QDY70705.1 DeoR/GlpR transcriptional regulator [Qingshengfaniella alkalisoli]
MSESDRLATISDLLRERPFISARELRGLVGVSPATIRRDIEKLASSGLAHKVHGGVAALEQSSPGAVAPALPFVENRDIAVDAKKAIARTAAELVRDGSLIIIHAGSTCFHFGCEIAQRNVRVFTNSMPVAAYLNEYGTCQLTIGGGDLHREPGVLYDPTREDYSFYASQFFVGALGVSSEGLLESNPLLVRFINEICGQANEIIVLVDSRKFEAAPPTVVLPLHRVNRLITDDGLSDRAAQMLDEEGVNYMVANVSESSIDR